MTRSNSESGPEPVETVDLPAEARHLGRDRKGTDHYLLPEDRIIVVKHDAAGDELVWVQCLDDDRVENWVEHITTTRGWLVCKYDDRDFAEWLLNPRVPQEAL